MSWPWTSNLRLKSCFDDYSVLNILKNVKAPTPITGENLNVPSTYKEKWAPVDHYISDKHASINGALDIHVDYLPT